MGTRARRDAPRQETIKSGTAAQMAMGVALSMHPMLAGHSPGVQGAALAEVLSCWLAGHDPAIREQVFQHHIALVRELTVVNAKWIRGEVDAKH